MTLKKGKRWSAAAAYLHPALRRPNLTVQTQALATRVLLDNGQAVGVEYLQHGTKRSARAAREVILAGGSINSPQLLMLSGIGEPEALRRLGIKPQVALSAVGDGLLDHTSAADHLPPQRRPVPSSGICVWTGSASHWRSPISSAAVSPPSCPSVSRRSSRRTPPSLYPISSSCSGWDRRRRRNLTSRRSSLPRPTASPAGSCQCARTSRGKVELASADPRDAGRIHQNFFGTQHEWKVMRDGLRMVRELAAQPALKDFVDGEMAPALNGKATRIWTLMCERRWAPCITRSERAAWDCRMTRAASSTANSR